MGIHEAAVKTLIPLCQQPEVGRPATKSGNEHPLLRHNPNGHETSARIPARSSARPKVLHLPAVKGKIRPAVWRAPAEETDRAITCQPLFQDVFGRHWQTNRDCRRRLGCSMEQTDEAVPRRTFDVGANRRTCRRRNNERNSRSATSDSCRLALIHVAYWLPVLCSTAPDWPTRRFRRYFARHLLANG